MPETDTPHDRQAGLRSTTCPPDFQLCEGLNAFCKRGNISFSAVEGARPLRTPFLPRPMTAQ